MFNLLSRDMIRKRWMVLSIVMVAVVIAIITLLLIFPGKSLPSLVSMGLTAGSKQPHLELLHGTSGLPKQADVDSEGFVAALTNDHFRLWIQLDSSQIQVEELATGHRWRSNPRGKDLANETVKGLLLSNLKSPFSIVYTKEGNTNREITNTTNLDLKMDYLVSDHVLQVAYNFTKLKMKFVLQYVLNEQGLVVKVPNSGIVESGDKKIISLDLLPFFGAAAGAAKDGYLFIPDGPGGLIDFDRVRTVTEAKSYYEPVYGQEMTNHTYDESQREQISFPVFGLKNQDQAFAAVITQGEQSAWISALPAGKISTFHSINAEFIYRQEYAQRLSRLSPPIKLIEKERSQQDRVIEYRLLSGQSANYVGMAHAYRDYLQASKQLPQQLAPVKQMPLELTLLGGNSRKTSFAKEYIATTTFSQAGKIVKQLQDDGLSNINVTYEGWQKEGDLHTGATFTVEPKLGGENGLQKLAAQLKQLGIGTLRLEMNLMEMNSTRTGALARVDGVRSIDGTVYYDDMNHYVMNPLQGVRYAQQWWETMSKLGVDGINFSEMGREVFRDYNSGHPLQREDTAYLYSGLMSHLQDEHANISVQRANAYAISGTNYINYIPMDSSHDFILDETVPFLQMVLHGNVMYSGSPGNLRDLYTEEQLKAIEYGAIPSFLLTYEPPRLLKDTSTWGVYSSVFSLWHQRVLDEMGKFQQLASIVNQEMIDHRRIRDGVYVTTYADGTEVEVDYGKGTFKVQGGQYG